MRRTFSFSPAFGPAPRVVQRAALCVLFVLLGSEAGVCGAAAAEIDPRSDWWQWGGPSRDFMVSAPRLAWEWSEGTQPRDVFRRPLAGGHSTVAVAGDQVLVQHGASGRELLTALDQSGVPLWEREFAVGFVSDIETHGGPHAAPLVLADRVLTVSIDATVRAWRRGDGTLLWQRDLRRDHGVTLPQAGFASSPLLVDQTVLLPGLGGAGPDYSRRPAAGLGALLLDSRTGETRWRASDFPSSHASPLSIGLPDGAGRLAIFHGMERLVSLHPVTGEQLGSFRLRSGAADNVSFTPLWDPANQQIIVSHAYDRHGAQAIALQGDGSLGPRRWANPRLKVEHGNALLWGELLLASDGSGPGFLVALDAKSGALQWKERLPKATLVGVRDQLVLILDADGELHVAQPDRKGSNVTATREVLDGLAWTAPSLVGRMLYVRDRHELIVLRLP